MKNNTSKSALRTTSIFLSAALALTGATAAFAQTYTGQSNVNQTAAMQQPTASVQMRQGTNFRYAIPAGWIVGEEGAHALSLLSPDRSAAIIVFGVSGLTQQVSAEQFTAYAMGQLMHLGNVQLLGSRPIQPMQGCADAALIEVAYVFNNQPCHGLVTCNIARGYGQCNGTITIAAAMEAQWPAYANWLPQVAQQAINTGGNAYGSTAIAQQNQQNAQAFGQQLQQNRQWSQQTQDEVSRQRAESQARQQAAMDPMLTGQQWYENPNGGQPIRESASAGSVWTNANGEIATFDSATADPRTASDNGWQQMKPSDR